jgi:hypothetical protein
MAKTPKHEEPERHERAHHADHERDAPPAERAAPAPLAPVTPIGITAATWAAGQATFTTASPHGYPIGRVVTIAGVSPAGYNGAFTTVTGTTGSTLVVAMPTNPGTYASDGSISPGNPKAIMTSMGIALDRNGDLWQTSGNALVWLANTQVVVNPVVE